MPVSAVGSTIVYRCVATAVSVLSVLTVGHRIFFPPVISRLFDKNRCRRSPAQVCSQNMTVQSGTMMYCNPLIAMVSNVSLFFF